MKHRTALILIACLAALPLSSCDLYRFDGTITVTDPDSGVSASGTVTTASDSSK